MGLFSKKPKPAPAVSDDVDPSSAPTPAAGLPAPVPAPAPAPAPAKAAKKSKKATIDPVDFLNLRAELMDVKARLMAAEQSRAIVESRLAALDATALALSSEQAGSTGAGERLAELEARVAELAQPGTDADDMAAVAALQASLQGRIDELAGQVEQQKAAAAAATAAAEAATAAAATASSTPAAAATVDPELAAKIDALEVQVAQATAAAEAARAEVAAKAEPPSSLLFTPAATPTVDPEVAARLDALGDRITAIEPLHERSAQIDDLAQRVAQIDVLAGQLSQLNARVSAQAEFGAQLSAMRDRITELQSDTEVRREAALVANDDAELRDRVNGLTDRMLAAEALAAQLGVLAERVAATDATARHASEQVAALEQRVDSVGTELANQISELGRDIDGLAARTADVASGTVSDEVMAALRNGQIKLANEQARYEIAFREDLAALAEHVRRNPPRA
ncbi:MAG: hypothetical protein RL238_3210 [Actinomycetota bacterium]|jgi:hypothetical protein